MQSDFEKTGRLYPKLEAYKYGIVPGGRTPGWNYFGSTAQFKTCKNFVAFLADKYPGEKFKAHKAED